MNDGRCLRMAHEGRIPVIHEWCASVFIVTVLGGVQMPDYETFDAICYDAYMDGYITPEEFATAMQAIFIEKGGYVLDVGNTGQVLAEILLRLQPKIHRQKFFWKKFMVG